MPNRASSVGRATNDLGRPRAYGLAAIAGRAAVADYLPICVAYGTCVLALRGDLGVTLNVAAVSAWADQTIAANHVSQGTGALQPPYNAKDADFRHWPTITFQTPANSSLVNAAANLIAQSATRTTMAAIRCDADGGSLITFINAATARSIHTWQFIGPDTYVYTDAVAVNGVITTDPPANFSATHAVTWAQPAPGTLIGLRVEGRAHTATGSNVTAEVAGSGFTVGNRQGAGGFVFRGVVGELLVFAGVTPTGTIRRIEAYIRNRYATA